MRAAPSEVYCDTLAPNSSVGGRMKDLLSALWKSEFMDISVQAPWIVWEIETLNNSIRKSISGSSKIGHYYK